jgi:hypothetical protein
MKKSNLLTDVFFERNAAMKKEKINDELIEKVSGGADDRYNHHEEMEQIFNHSHTDPMDPSNPPHKPFSQKIP